jgi:hypothetical protein
MSDPRTITNPISTLQELIAARIAAADCFIGPMKIQPLTQRTGDLFNAIDRELKRLGLCIFIATPKVKVSTAIVSVSIIVEENVSFNQGKTGSKIAAEDAALAISQLLAWGDLQEGQTERQAWRPADWIDPFFNIGYELQGLDPRVVFEVTADTRIFLKMS